MYSIDAAAQQWAAGTNALATKLQSAGNRAGRLTMSAPPRESGLFRQGGRMDYYQGVVVEYLRANRAVFVNTECCIQLNAAENPDGSGPHWYCDAVAVNFEERCVYLCEVSFSVSVGTLLKRLVDWRAHWPGVKAALVRDCHLDPAWPVRPWAFVPEAAVPKAVQAIVSVGSGLDPAAAIPVPRIRTLEMVVPWKYRSWNRKEEAPKAAVIPDSMK